MSTNVTWLQKSSTVSQCLRILPHLIPIYISTIIVTILLLTEEPVPTSLADQMLKESMSEIMLSEGHPRNNHVEFSLQLLGIYECFSVPTAASIALPNRNSHILICRKTTNYFLQIPLIFSIAHPFEYLEYLYPQIQNNLSALT